MKCNLYSVSKLKLPTQTRFEGSQDMKPSRKLFIEIAQKIREKFAASPDS